MIRNQEVAALLERIAELLEAKGESPYRIGAYRNAARRIAGLPEDIQQVWQAGRLRGIPGVGESIAAKIDEYLRTGRLQYLDELSREVAPGLADLLVVPGLGPRRAQLLHARLGITSVAQLVAAAQAHRLCGLPGFGEKMEANLLREALRLTQRTRRLPLGVALPVAEEVAGLLREHPAVQRIEPAGSIRRRCETIGDIDLLVASAQPDQVIAAFATLPITREVLSQGTTRASILTAANLQVDLRVIAPEVYGAALQYFTGSKEHNIALREFAIRKGYKLSEYGLFDERSGRRLASATEEEVYHALGLPWIPPELRENRGEIEAALAGRLPRLITEQDLLGDLHAHSTWSDGTDSLEAMAEAARARGYAYLGITEHSRGLGIARGLTPERVRELHRDIEALNARMHPFRILHGAEVNIRRDGRLDYPDELLRSLDFVVVAVHSAFDLPEDMMTARIRSALRNLNTTILAHPHGRLLGKREPYAVDMEAIIRAARTSGVALEINGQPDRLDLNDIWARRAKEAGALLAIGTDAHSVHQLDYVRYAIAVARRAWVEPQDVLNTRPLEELLSWRQWRRLAA